MAAGASGVRRGQRAEALARSYLEDKGFKVVDKNRRLGGGELDLVAWDRDTLVFVEVKARSGSGFGTPEEAVDANKRRRLAGAARAYLAKLEPPQPVCRFDVVALDLGHDRPVVRHLPDAFRLGD